MTHYLKAAVEALKPIADRMDKDKNRDLPPDLLAVLPNFNLRQQHIVSIEFNIFDCSMFSIPC